MFAGLLSSFRKVVAALEDTRVPFVYSVLTFCGCIALRTFFEVLVTQNDVIKPVMFLEYVMLYIVLALCIILLFKFATKKSAAVLARVVLPFFAILLLVPLIDILAGWKGYPLMYLIPEIHGPLLPRFFTFFGNAPDAGGISLGMRIEMALAIIGSGLYFYISTLQKARSIIYAIAVYVIFFLLAASPYWIAAIYRIAGFSYDGINQVSDSMFIRFFLIISAIVTASIAYLENKRLFHVLVKDLRLLRIAHYVLMILFGVILGMQRASHIFGIDQLFAMVLIPLALVSAVIFSIVMNNTADIEIDRITNSDRPLVQNEVTLHTYHVIGWTFFVLSLIFAAAVSMYAFFFIALFILVYFLYSMPPLRLKRVPFFSKVLIALNTLFMTMLGFLSTSRLTILDFPFGLGCGMVIMYTFAAQLIDLKDYEGDKRAGIQTLPVLLGLSTARLVIGSILVLAYMSVYLLLPDTLLILPLVVFGCLQFHFVMKVPYHEKPIFVTYIISLLMLLLYCCTIGSGFVSGTA